MSKNQHRHSNPSSTIESCSPSRASSLLDPLLPSRTRGRSQARSESALLSGIAEAEEAGTRATTAPITMHRHRAGGAGGGGGHNNTRGRRGAEPFLVYDDPTFAVSSSTFIPSLADRVPVPAGEQRWLRYDSRGKASYVDTSDATKNKHALVMSLQLPARDLIMCDPTIPTPIPPALLIREKALVVVMGALRMVIGADRVYLLSVPAAPSAAALAAAAAAQQQQQPLLSTMRPGAIPPGFSFPTPPPPSSSSSSSTLPLLATANAASNTDASWKFPDINGAFEADLSRRLAAAAAARDEREAALRAAAAARASRATSSYEGEQEEEGSGFDAGRGGARRSSALDEIDEFDEDEDIDVDGDGDDETHEHREPLPYELCALEAALAATTSALRDDANAIAAATLPALERLGSAESVTRGGLEAVRSAKLAIKRCEARVEAVKRELSEIIDDDEDLRDCLLSRRREERREAARVEVARAAAALAEGQGGEGEGEGDEEAPPPPPVVVSSPPAARGGGETTPQQQQQQLRRRGSSLVGSQRGGGSSVVLDADDLHRTQRQIKERAEVLLVENLLESYYLQVGQILSRLAVLKERIDDTEDLVNVELDAKRNSIFILNLVVSLLTAALAFVSAVAGVMGQNLNPLPVEKSPMAFVLITSFAVVVGALIFVGTLYFARVKGLLHIPKAPKSL